MVRIALFLTMLALLVPQTSWAQHKHQKITSKMSLDARHKAQLKVIKHDKDVLRFFRNHHWLMMAKSPCAQKARAAVKFHQAQLRWMRKELKETRTAIKLRDHRRYMAALRRATPEYAIRLVFGSYAGQALAVARCESGLYTGAQNGQYLGLFQMGSGERARYGHGSDAMTQARAAFAYFVASGRDWSPWECKPW